MAWDETQPLDTTKIRNLGTVIRPNWSAIETADTTFQPYAVNLTDRTPLVVANDPAAISGATNAVIVYCKQDGSGNQELFTIDPSSNIVQITEVGKIGSATTQLVVQDISFSTETATYDSGNMVAYWANVASTGTLTDSSGGITSLRNSLGKYTLTFTVAQANTTYGVNSSAETSGGNPHTANYHTKTVNTFKINIRNPNGTLVDNPFTVSVFGGRA